METEHSSEYTGFLSLQRLINGPWQAFERAIARLLTHKGWEICDIVAGSGDKGADIIASHNGVEKIFQVKFSENNTPLSVDIVGDVKRALEFYGISAGVCVSNRPLGEHQERKLQILNDQGYRIEKLTGKSLLDSYNEINEWPVDKRSLRQYQQESLDALMNSYTNNSRRGLITLATGLGKTYVAACFLRWLYENDPKLRIVIFADKKELISQFDRAIWTNIPKSVATHLLYESEKPTFNEGIILSTFQSFDNYYKKYTDLEFDLVIVDEAHHVPADTFNNTISKISPKYLLGLTATPFRKDNRSVTEIFGEPLVKYDVIKAMHRGYLSSVDYHIKNDNIDKDWVSLHSKKGYTIKQLNKKLFILERDDAICKLIIDYWNFKKPERGIIFCNSNLHAAKIEKILRSNYLFNARSLTVGIKDQRERARRIREFRKGNINILTCYNMLNEGVDVPDVDLLVYLRVTHSRVIFLQQLGRGLRYKEGKTLLVLDFVADLRRIAEVQKFKNNFCEEEDYTNTSDIEEIKLPSEFKLSFNDAEARNFLNLVTRDISELEEMSLDDKMYIPDLRE
jgi:superfamily II DNA or RNA helicase